MYRGLFNRSGREIQVHRPTPARELGTTPEALRRALASKSRIGQRAVQDRQEGEDRGARRSLLISFANDGLRMTQ